MIQCSFCSISKSQKYLYTACNHFVCINCAALISRDGLKCCNIITELPLQVRQQLQKRKSNILKNLENQYEYEKTDLDLIQFAQLEKGLSNKQQEMKNQYELKSKRKCKNINNKSQSQTDQINNTPINQFYKNPLILNQKFHNIPQQSTPIKRISSMQVDEKDPVISQVPPNLVSFNKIAQQNFFQQRNQTFNHKKEQIHNRNRFIPELLKQQFSFILTEKLQSVRNEFKIMYGQMQKKQATIIYQLKVYFEEYLKLLQKQNPNNGLNQIMQKERINVFLNGQIDKWNIKQMKDIICLGKSQEIREQKKENQWSFAKSLQKQEKYLKDNKNALNNRNIKNQITSVISCEKTINNQNNRMQQRYSQSFEEPFAHSNYISALQIRQKSQQSLNQNRKPQQTGRNLDKIYKKLQQSRTKLQQRISRHNWFMSQRCSTFNRI